MYAGDVILVISPAASVAHRFGDASAVVEGFGQSKGVCYAAQLEREEL